MELIKLQNKEGQIVVSSRVVAEQLGKEHKHVLEKLKEIGQDFDPSWITTSEYKDSMNRTKKEYLLNKDGFIMLCMNYQGYNEFKKSYINQFNKMEKKLKNKYKVPTSLKEALKLALEQQEKIENLEIENKVKEQQISEYKPKIEYLDTILNSQDTMTISQIAADYGLSGIKLNKILHKHKIQRKVGGQWLLYSNHMNKGYTKSETTKILLENNKTKLIVNTKWTQKGRIKIHEILLKEGKKANMDKANFILS